MTAVALCLGLLAPAAAGAPAAKATTPPFLRDVGALERSLRVAIEDKPRALAESLTASEQVCDLGSAAEAGAESAAAAADWSTLEQIVARTGEPELEMVEGEFERARRKLDNLVAAYERAWSRQSHRRRSLRGAAASTRRGIAGVEGSLKHLSAAFGGWRTRGCDAALSEIYAFRRGAAFAVETVGAGMGRLWGIAESLTARRRGPAQRSFRTEYQTRSATSTSSSPALANRR